MGGFLYFIPGETEGRWTHARAVAAGLGHAVMRGDSIHSRGCVGPKGQPGVLLSVTVDPLALRYAPNEQTWRRIPQASAWVGVDRADLPTPDALARADTLPGERIVLCDGNEWECPTVRAWNTQTEPITWGSRVARMIDWDDAGERVAGEVVAMDRAVWDAASRWWDTRLGVEVDGTTLHFSEAIDADLAVTALGRNYRVGRAEIGLLGLLDERTELDILDAMIDWRSFVEWTQKKTLSLADGSSIAHGQADDSPVIDQPSLTSGLSDANEEAG